MYFAGAERETFVVVFLDASHDGASVAADLVATLDGHSRDDVDAFAVESQKRASRAWDEGRFARAVITVSDFNGIADTSSAGALTMHYRISTNCGTSWSHENTRPQGSKQKPTTPLFVYWHRAWLGCPEKTAFPKLF